MLPSAHCYPFRPLALQRQQNQLDLSKAGTAGKTLLKSPYLAGPWLPLRAQGPGHLHGFPGGSSPTGSVLTACFPLPCLPARRRHLPRCQAVPAHVTPSTWFRAQRCAWTGPVPTGVCSLLSHPDQIWPGDLGPDHSCVSSLSPYVGSWGGYRWHDEIR